ncbi:MAG: dihydroneopterin aldolase [Synechococcales bacterium]|nr:dihydroneopterin aldolase [Synechococcales bacterium]
MDTIEVTGIRAYGYTGALPEENVLGQWFEVNLTLWCDLIAAGKSDRLTDTYDYRSAIQTVQTLVKTSRFVLIEKLAAAIADALLEDPILDQVEVRLTKVSPPIPDFSGSVVVTIRRDRHRCS